MGTMLQQLAAEIGAINAEIAAQVQAALEADAIEDAAVLAAKDDIIAERDLALDAAQTALNAAQSALDEANQAIAAKNAEILAAQQSITALQASVADRDTTIAGLNQSVAEKNAEIADLEQSVATLTSQLAAVQGNVTALQQSVADLQTQVSTLQATVTAKNAEIDAAQQTIAQKNATIADRDATIVVLEARIAELEANQPAPPPPEPTVADVVWEVRTVQTSADEGTTMKYIFEGTVDDVTYVLNPTESAWFEFGQTGAQVEDFSTNQTSAAQAAVAAAIAAMGPGYAFEVNGTTGNRRVMISGGRSLFFELTRTIVADATTEGPEVITMDLLGVSAGTIGVPSVQWTINDTSITPDAAPPPPPSSTVPTTAAYKALSSNTARQAYVAEAEAWYAANTGVRPGVTLTAYTGSTTITANNVTIRNKRITGSLRVTGSNFLMEDCEIITNGGTWGVDAEGASNPTIRYCKFVGPAGGGNSAYLGVGVFEFNNVSLWQNGVASMGSGRIEWNYLHDLGPVGAVGEAHVDGIGLQGGLSNLLVAHNFIRSWDTSCIILSNDFGGNNNVDTERNWMLNQSSSRQTAYAMYFYGSNGGTVNSSIVDNVIERGWAGYFSISQATPTPFTGNVIYPSGAAINS